MKRLLSLINNFNDIDYWRLNIIYLKLILFDEIEDIKHRHNTVNNYLENRN